MHAYSYSNTCAPNNIYGDGCVDGKPQRVIHNLKFTYAHCISLPGQVEVVYVKITALFLASVSGMCCLD